MLPGSPEHQVFSKLSSDHVTLAVAESCTGGLVAHRITNIPGVSPWFLGGIVAYSNQAKVQLLDVDPGLLSQHGAVSEPVARQMADGARMKFRADYAVGITGIAGPDGGSAEKPVGLVYIATADSKITRAKRFLFEGDRDEVKKQSADAAFMMLLDALALDR